VRGKWTFERLLQTHLYVFAELGAALEAGTEADISDERMTEMHMAWAETLAIANWTSRQFERAERRHERSIYNGKG